MSSQKKKREICIFEESLVTARLNGGESRRNVDHLRGEILERGKQDERPDIVVRVPGKTRKSTGRIVGIEHFRIDQLVEQNVKRGHLDAVTPIAHAQMCKARSGQWCKPDGEICKESLQELADSLARILRADEESHPRQFSNSFEAILSSHIEKADSYRKNIESMAGSTTWDCELAFLLEIHVSFVRLCFNRGFSSRKMLPGEFALWPEIFSALKDAAKHIDYFIVALYSSTDDDIRNAFVVNSRNFERSLQRNGMPLVKHYGENRLTPGCKRSNLTLSFEKNEVGYGLVSGGSSETMTPETVMNECLRWLPKALADRRKKIPFTATASMQTLIEFFWDCLPEVSRNSIVSLDEIGQYWADMPNEERFKRSMEFKEKYFGK